MNAKLDAKSRFGDVFKSSFIFVAAIVALVFGPLRAIAADADLYEAYQIGTEKESTNQFFMREVGKEEGKPVYCVNLHKERPPVKERLNSNTGKKEFPQYAKQDATSDFARYTDGDKSSLNSRLMFALWNGYPNDAMGLKDAGAIDNIQAFTSATQHAVWHITDGYDSPLASQNDTTAKIYKVLIGEAQEFDYFNTKIKPQKVPTELKLSVYEPLNNVPNEGYKQWQNLISTEFVNEVGESVKPKPVKPGEGEGEKFFEFSFKKLDMDNNVPVIGAGLKIQDQNKKAGVKTSLEGVGTNIHQWDTSDTAQKIWLKPGAYLLYETKIAGGYVLPDSGLKTPLNMLEVNDDGKVTLADTGSKYVKTENTAINVYNKRNAEVPKPNSAGKKKIRISKFAEGATAQELKNAELALYKGEYSQEVPGDIVAIKTWISGPVIDVELDEGSYTLVEKNAPEGFDKAENIVFKNESGKVFLKNGDRWSETTKLVPVDATPFRAYSDFNDESTSWKGTPFGKFYYIDHDKKNESVDGDEVIYCFNVNRKAPMESYDYGESVNAWDKVEPKFKAEYDQKSMKGYAHKPRIEDPLKFGEAIQRVIYAGYPKNAMKFGDELTPAAFRTITQLAIYNFSDSFGLEEIAKLNENEAHGFFGILKPENVKIKEAYEKLIQYAVSDSELPEDSRVPFYVTNNIEYQNFIGTWMNPQSVIPVVEMIDKVIVPQDKAKTASVVFSKVVAGQGDELKGASLKVVKGEKADGEVVKSWTSTGTPETFALEPGVYTLVEDQAPLGFMKAEAITFRVGFDKDHANGMVEIKAGDKWTLAKNSVVVMQDKAKTASVVFSKVVAGQGDELKGASLKVVKGEKADGEVVKSWTSTGTPETFALEPGVYTLVEDQAPLGFMKAEAITFRVGFDKDHANGMVEIKAGDKWTLAKNSVVVMQDKAKTASVVFSKVVAGQGDELKGASLKVVKGEKADGEVVKSWTSTGTPETFALEPGVYTLVEDQAPLGFMKAEAITFRVGFDKDHANGMVEIKAGDKWTLAKNSVVVMQDKAKTASVVFSKVVAGQGDELKGASLKVVKGEKADGEVVKSWTSTGTPETFALEPGVYTLVEDQAPLGFMKAEAITFRVGFDKDHANGMVEIKAGDKWTLAKNSVVVMQDKAKTASVVFSKVVAGQGDELKGASLKVVKGEKADGEVVKSWTSTGTPETFALEPGVYTLVEDQAPLGFMKAEAITFRVGFDKDHANGMVEIKAGDKWTLAKNSVVVMQDKAKTASVVFSKVVAGQGDELKGASLKVVKGEKADGEVVKSWTSTGTPETFALEPGVYTLVEDQAPLGFMKAEAITFRVGFDKDHANGMVEIKAGDKWTLAKNSVVVMQDEREKTPDTPTKPEEPKTPEAPKVVPSPKFEDSKKSGLARTGLDLGVAGMVATGLIAAGVLGLAARKRNKA